MEEIMGSGGSGGTIKILEEAYVQRTDDGTQSSLPPSYTMPRQYPYDIIGWEKMVSSPYNITAVGDLEESGVGDSSSGTKVPGVKAAVTPTTSGGGEEDKEEEVIDESPRAKLTAPHSQSFS